MVGRKLGQGEQAEPPLNPRCSCYVFSSPLRVVSRIVAASFRVKRQCVELSRSACYRVPEHWTVRDAQLIGALATLVEGRPNRGFWKCRKILRRHPVNGKKVE
jgi:hypothetical protein